MATEAQKKVLLWRKIQKIERSAVNNPRLTLYVKTYQILFNASKRSDAWGQKKYFGFLKIVHLPPLHYFSWESAGPTINTTSYDACRWCRTVAWQMRGQLNVCQKWQAKGFFSLSRVGRQYCRSNQDFYLRSGYWSVVLLTPPTLLGR